MKELCHHLEATVPIFDRRGKYLNRHKSKIALQKWLDDYIGRDKSHEMLHMLLQVANDEAARKHCTYLYGEPNTGKSTLIAFVADACINRAQHIWITGTKQPSRCKIY